MQSIAKGYQDPHYVQAKPSFMRRLNRADLLIYVGLELEVGWLPLIIQGARNPHIAPGAAGHLEASAGINRLEVPEGQVDRSMGDIHPEGNPHYLLDPRNGLIVAQTVADRLAQLDPEHATAFQENLQRFQSDLTARIAEWETRLSSLREKKVVTYHKLWEYLTHWLQIEIAGQVENKPGIPPSPRHVAELIDRMKTDGITLLLTSDYSDPKPAERVAQQVGAAIFALTRTHQSRVPQEAIIGIVYAVSAAAGILVIDRAPHGAEHIKQMLVGAVLWVTWTDVAKITAIYLLVGLFHWIFRKRFLTISFDETRAVRERWSVRAWDFLFYASFGIVTTNSVPIAGVLLVFSFLIVPAVCAAIFTDHIGKRLAIGWAIGFFVSALGCTASYLMDLPTGATVVCMFGIVLILLAIIKRLL